MVDISPAVVEATKETVEALIMAFESQDKRLIRPLIEALSPYETKLVLVAALATISNERDTIAKLKAGR